jgi:two-component system sensor histidine kinase KdpD
LAHAISPLRQLYSGISGAVLLAALTTGLQSARGSISLTIVFLLYLATVVALAAAGGPIVGVASAIIAFLVVNFFFTEPLHTFDVSDPERLAELIIFLAVSGTVATLVATATHRRDVLEVRTAEAESLAATNELRTALLRAVSHDLRTPLTTAKMATSSLLADDIQLSSSASNELLHLADSEIDRLVLIVENLLDAGRLQAGAVAVDLQPTAIDDVVDRVLRSIPEADRASVILRVRSDLPVVDADPALLERVISNLVSNALAADPGGEVTVAALEVADGRVAVDVVDHGPGMSIEQRATALQPFHRFEDRGSPSGIGLGLAICEGFCEAMGAHLELHDTVGSGLTARVLLARAT